MNRLLCSVEAHKNKIEVRVYGRLGSGQAEGFCRILAAMANGAKDHLVLDLMGLIFISSAGLQGLWQTAQTMRGSGRKFLLCGVQPRILGLLETSGFDKWIEMRPERQTALAETREAGPPASTETATPSGGKN